MNKIIEFIKKNNGYARMKELKQAGFHTRSIKMLHQAGSIQKVKPGLYKLPDVVSKGNYSQGFIDVCNANPKGVICLLSALEYHNLTDANPSKIYMALPNKDKLNKIAFPPVEVYYFRDRFYNCAIQEITTKTGSFKIYNAEKTICDMFRYRNKLGEDLALEGLKNYLKRKDASINKLWEYAIQCRVKTVMHPYIKAMVA